MFPHLTPRAADAASCPHCGAAVESLEDSFCSAACELACDIIYSAGLDRYYAQRTKYAPRPEPAAGGWNAVPVAERDDGTREARLMIDGLRCSSCVWVLERVLEAMPGVRHAHVSYATGRALVRWVPEQSTLDALANRIAALGYTPRALAEASRTDRALILRLRLAAVAAMNVLLRHQEHGRVHSTHG